MNKNWFYVFKKRQNNSAPTSRFKNHKKSKETPENDYKKDAALIKTLHTLR